MTSNTPAQSAESIRIGLIGDTHLPARGKRLGPLRRWQLGHVDRPRLWRAVHRAWGEVDEIWHTGDLADPDVLRELQAYFSVPVAAVRGDADRGRHARALPRSLVFERCGQRIVMMHGGGSPRFIVDRIARAVGWAWDAVVFGHTHLAFQRRIEGVLFVNPGSPTDRKFTRQRTVATLTIARRYAAATVCPLENEV